MSYSLLVFDINIFNIPVVILSTCVNNIIVGVVFEANYFPTARYKLTSFITKPR